MPVVVLANKQDLPNALNEAEVGTPYVRSANTSGYLKSNPGTGLSSKYRE